MHNHILPECASSQAYNKGLISPSNNQITSVELSVPIRKLVLFSILT